MRFLYSLYCIITFVAFFLLLFPFFLLFGMFGKRGRKINWYLIRCWSYAWFFVIVMPVRVKGKEYIDKRKKYIVVGNHRSYLDTAMIFRTVPFYAKPLAKSELGKIPLFGYLYRQMTVMVQRDNDKSKAQSIRSLKKQLRREGSIFIFPEGTFNETEEWVKSFYDGAFRIAIETQTPILPVVFPDTRKRMPHALRFGPGITRAIFLREVPLEVINRHSIQSLKEMVQGQMAAALAHAD